MKKLSIVVACCVFYICGCAISQKLSLNHLNEEQLEKNIILNLNKIEEVTDMTSSNPYDYTKNEYYNNIVKLGDEAVPILEKMYIEQKLSGVASYLSALAIQDITKCNLQEEYNLDWSTADEFYNLWKENNCMLKNK